MAGDCPIIIQPPKLVVEFGDSATANCFTTINNHGMGWEAVQGGIDMVEGVQFLPWRVESLTLWDIEPMCYINAETQHVRRLQVTVYSKSYLTCWLLRYNNVCPECIYDMIYMIYKNCLLFLHRASRPGVDQHR